MALNALAVFWLVAGAVGIWTWGVTWADSINSLRAMYRSGENGVMRAIARQARTRNSAIWVSVVLNVSAAAVALLLPPDSTTRLAYTRAVVTLSMVIIAALGFYMQRSDATIWRAIRRLRDHQEEGSE